MVSESSVKKGDPLVLGDPSATARFSEPKPFVYDVSQSLAVKKLCVTDKKSMHIAEQILRSTFRITVKELREFYEKHEIFALWYKDRMTSATIISTHPTISMVNVVFFATMGYLSNLHFGTVLDNFIKYYATQRGCNTVLVTALDMSMDFWRKQGYQEFQVTEEFSRAYVAAGAVQLRNTIFLSFRPEATAVTLALKQSAIDADEYLLERAEKSARSTIALRVLARHGTGSQTRYSRRSASTTRAKMQLDPPMPAPPPSEKSESEVGTVLSTNTQGQDPSRKCSPKLKTWPGLPTPPVPQLPAKARGGLDAWNQREERHRRRDQLRDYRQQLWRQYLLRMAGKKEEEPTAKLSTPPAPKRHKPDTQSQLRARRSQRTLDGNESSGSGDDTYRVDQVLQMKEEDGQRFFLVKWTGYATEDSTWEPMENILDDALLQPFVKEKGSPACSSGTKAHELDGSSSSAILSNQTYCDRQLSANISDDDAVGRSHPQAPHQATVQETPNNPSPDRYNLSFEVSNASADSRPPLLKPTPKLQAPRALYSSRVLRSAELKSRYPLRG
eukprot:GGOE01005274.1.p1 GENE.GGOE01005274.1~~GGOE01005274.1.p1  ORF type:complete len:558 (-),score=80.94 GGOE01005274.1:436-2109(-)